MKQHLLKSSILALGLSCFSSFAIEVDLEALESEGTVIGNVQQFKNRLGADGTSDKLLAAINTVSNIIGVKSSTDSLTIIDALDDLGTKIGTDGANIPQKLSTLLSNLPANSTVESFRANVVDELYGLVVGSVDTSDLTTTAQAKKDLITGETGTIITNLDTLFPGSTTKPTTISALVDLVSGENSLQVELGRATNAGTGMGTQSATKKGLLSAAASITEGVTLINSILGGEGSTANRFLPLETQSDTPTGGDVYTGLLTALEDTTLETDPAKKPDYIFDSVAALKAQIIAQEAGLTPAEAISILDGTIENPANVESDFNSTISGLLTTHIGVTDTISTTGGIIDQGTANSITTINPALTEISNLIGTPAQRSGRQTISEQASFFVKIKELMERLGGTSNTTLYQRVIELKGELLTL